MIGNVKEIKLVKIIGIALVMVIIFFTLSYIFNNIKNDNNAKIVEDIAIQGKQMHALTETVIEMGKTVEGRITMGNTATIQINGTSSSSFTFVKVDDEYVDAQINGQTLVIKGNKVGTTEIKIKDSSTNKIAVYKVTIMTANYSVNSDNTTVYYCTLSDAMSQVASGSTINVLQNVSETQGLVIDKNMTIDLQDKKISMSSIKVGIEVKENVTLSIKGQETGEIYLSKDTVETTDENKKAEDHMVIFNKGILNITGGKLTGECSGRT